MKLSVDRFHAYEGFVLVLQALGESLRGGASCSRRLQDQPFSGIAGLLAQAVQRTLGLEDRRHPARGSRLDMPHAFPHAQRAWLLLPQ
jgi:hypothetical protein